LQWIELHGDRGGFDDPALVCGIGSMDGMSFMFIGHQKGRNTKENIHRNFAMPMPNGYVFTFGIDCQSSSRIDSRNPDFSEEMIWRASLLANF